MPDQNAMHSIITVDGVDIYSAMYDVRQEVTRATINTLTNNKLGLAGSIAYIDKGAALYERFKKAHLPGSDPAQSEAAKLITTHKSALTKEIEDSERIIIIGSGSYDSIVNQELALVSNLFAHENKPPLKEIVLIDVSVDFLTDGMRAIKDFEEKQNVQLKTIPIRSDFKRVSGDMFDAIMEAYGSKKREELKSAVLLTGATFGNIESVSAMDRFPGTEIDVQMGHLADFVGKGSTVMFDYFTKLDTGTTYYNTPELSQFFNNIPNIMRAHCKNLEDFSSNPSPHDETFFHYRAKPLSNARMIAHELIAETSQMPKIVNGIERVMPISRGDALTLMFSLRARADDIYSRPVQNTGLESSFYVSSKDLVMHSFKRVGTPGAIHQPEINYQTPEPSALRQDNVVARKTASDSLLGKLSRPFTLRPMIGQPA